MQVYNIEVKNSLPVLTELIETIRNFSDSKHVYLSSTYDNYAPQAAVPKHSCGISEAALPEILNKMGIRSLTLDSAYNEQAIYKYNFNLAKGDGTKSLWHEIKSDQLIFDLMQLFGHCRTIAFNDWTNVVDSSELWDGLLSDVIRPLKKTDLEFIFYLGDPSKKLFFEVDEILDIMTEFSKHGQVTVCLDENEAINLWMVLNGEHPDTTFKNYIPSDLKRKYLSIYNTVQVERLLIYSANDAILYSKDQQFVFTRKVVDHNIEMAEDARDNFVMGYTIGLLQQLQIQHCIALGLIFFGAHGEYKAKPDQTALLDYVESWIADLEKPDSISLYQ